MVVVKDYPSNSKEFNNEELKTVQLAPKKNSKVNENYKVLKCNKEY